MMAQLRTKARVLSKLALHPADEVQYHHHPNDLRPPLALNSNLRKLFIPRFVCTHASSNIVTCMAKEGGLHDQNGYVVSFTSFEEILENTENTPPGPDECVLVASDYYSQEQLHSKRYRATVLTTDTMVEAITIFEKGLDLSNKEDEELIGIFLDTLHEKLPTSANLHDNFKFINEYMRSLLDDESQPCWERGRMKVYLQQEASVDIDSVEIKKFTARWIANNIPFRFKIIAHKTDGAHRDFAHDILSTGLMEEEEYFLKVPQPLAQSTVNIEFSIPSKLDGAFIEGQKQKSLDKQSQCGLDVKLEGVDSLRQVLTDFRRNNPDISDKFFITEKTLKLLLKTSPSRDAFLDCLRDFELENFDAIETEVRAIPDSAWDDVFPMLLEHVFIYDRATRLGRFLTQRNDIPKYLLDVLKNSGIDLEKYFPDVASLKNILCSLLLPKSSGKGENLIAMTTKGFCRWDAHSYNSKGKSGRTNTVIHMLVNNKALFTDPKTAKVKGFFTQTRNATYYYDIGSGERTKSELIPAPLMASFWILLYSFISPEVSDEVGNFLRKAHHASPRFLRQMTIGDELKAVNYLVMTLANILDDYGHLADAFQKAFDSVKIRDGATVDFPRKPKFDRFLSILMCNSALRGFKFSREYGIDAVPQIRHREALGTILQKLTNQLCCTKTLNCNCPRSTFGNSVLNLAVMVEALTKLDGNISRGFLLESISSAAGESLEDKLDFLFNCSNDDRFALMKGMSSSIITSSCANSFTSECLSKRKLSLLDDKKYEALQSVTQKLIERNSPSNTSRARRSPRGVNAPGAAQSGAQLSVGDTGDVNAPGADAQIPVEDDAQLQGGVDAGLDGQGDQGGIESNKTSKSKKRSRTDQNGEEGAPSKRSKRAKKKKMTDELPDTVTSAEASVQHSSLTCENIAHFIRVLLLFSIFKEYMDPEDDLIKEWEEYVQPQLDSGDCAFEGCDSCAGGHYLFEQGIKEKEIAALKLPFCTKHWKDLRRSDNFEIEDSEACYNRAIQDSGFSFICATSGRNMNPDDFTFEDESS